MRFFGFTIAAFVWLSLLAAADLSAQEPIQRRQFQWTAVEDGFHLGRYDITPTGQVLRSEVFLLKFSLQSFELVPVLANDLGKPMSDLRSLTLKKRGVAGINTHFFDENSEPLGLLIDKSQQINRMHKGGKLLTGVFAIGKQGASIVHRSAFKAPTAFTALQAGPRLVVAGKATDLTGSKLASRRSGVAVTRSGEVILFATLLRFPGASFTQLQEMLLDPLLEVTDALNLDGGGSSQLFIAKNNSLPDEVFISGGDDVPVGLIARKRN